MLIICSTHVDYIKHSRTNGLNLTSQNAPSHPAFSSLQRRQHSAVSHCKTHWRGTRKGCDIAILHHQPGKLEHRRGLVRRWLVYVCAPPLRADRKRGRAKNMSTSNAFPITTSKDIRLGKVGGGVLGETLHKLNVKNIETFKH